MKTLDFLLDVFRFRDSLKDSRKDSEAVLPIENLRYSLNYQSAVSATVVRAKELAIHLRNKYGAGWKKYVGEVKLEEENVIRELEKIDISKPVVSMTSDNVPIVLNGFHTVCAYRNLGYRDIEVSLTTPYRKSSKEFYLKSFDNIKIY